MSEKKEGPSTVIDKIETVGRYCIVSGYKSGYFQAAAYEGSRMIKSFVVDDLNAPHAAYEKLRQWIDRQEKEPDTK